MSLIAKVALAALVLTGLGGALWWHFESIYALFLLPLPVLLRLLMIRLGIVLARIGFGRLMLLIFLAYLPMAWRLLGRKHVYKLRHWCQTRYCFGMERWEKMSRAIRFIVAVLGFTALCVAAAFSGLVLFLITLIPFRLPGGTLFGAWIKGKIVPYLARVATGLGLDKVFPRVWKTIPARFRTYVGPRYRKLWRWTVRRLIKNRQIQIHTYSRRSENYRLIRTRIDYWH